MLIIGLNAYHGDAAACILRDGEIVAAAEEERFRRVKHWAGFPSMAIRACLAEAGATLSDVDAVAVNSDPKASLLRRVGYVALNRPDPRLVIDRLRNQKKRHSIEQELSDAFPGETFRGAVHRIEHHLAHMASTFLVSPFRRAVTVSIDGFGDFASAAWGVGDGTALSLDGRVWFPHSLGVFYQAITQFIGFPHYGDEYKVMGLAPYGEPRYVDKMRRIVQLKDDGSFRLDLTYFRHHKEKVAYEWAGGSPHVGMLYAPALVDLLGPARGNDEPLDQRHRDLARSAQAMYEEAFFHLLGRLHDRYGCDALTLAGGCAMNSVANGKVLRRSKFRQLYVQSAAGDAGGAIGAAMAVWAKSGQAKDAKTWSPAALRGDAGLPHPVMEHAYLGPSADAAQIAKLLEERGEDLASEGCSVEILADDAVLCRTTAGAVSRGEVVGWFQGRMEWGPRALGNRSIIGDPRRADMKDILNLKIKRRESFRPFAPSVLQEHVAAWFEEEGDVPFMMQVYQILEERRPQIPAVTHVDGSGRLQSVYKQTNPRYWALIEAFRQITGVPMVLNTSFNENEPVVCTPTEALDCFLRTKMDVLVLGETFIRRR